jgi:DNA-directed RNA polymerase subunit beta'
MGGEASASCSVRATNRRRALSDQLRKEMKETTSEAKRKKIAKRLKVVEASATPATSPSG